MALLACINMQRPVTGVTMVGVSSSAVRMARLRARRAAEESRLRLVPPPPAELLLPSVEATIAALNLGPEDAAIAALARLLASTMDELEDQAVALRRLGPLLRRVLAQLHATPMSRARVLPSLPATGGSRLVRIANVRAEGAGERV